jgi:hypothetical protein
VLFASPGIALVPTGLDMVSPSRYRQCIRAIVLLIALSLWNFEYREIGTAPLTNPLEVSGVSTRLSPGVKAF